MTGVSIDSQQAMLEVRNNAKLRLELGEYFLNSQAIYEDIMPVRIEENKQKVPGVNGYSQLGRLRSREYVALLTLARLDGTFDKDASNSEQIILGQDGIAIEGQHRFASDSSYRDWETNRKSTRLNSSHRSLSRMPSSA